MTPEQWREIEEIYHAALECDAGQRTEFVDKACAGNEALRRRVQDLLEAQEVGGDFLAQPALEVAAKAAVVDASVSIIGRQVSHYDVLSPLGAGGMGEVFLAKDVRLDRTVALKMLPSHLASDPDRLSRFLLEAKAASAFNHQNVAAIYDIGESEGRRFIAMEYVKGQTLAEKIDGRPVDRAEIIAIGIQVADALSEAHSKGIIHRDIKSANLMLTPRGQVKVLDFGLAKVRRPTEGQSHDSITIQNRTQPGGLLGTVRYMSPEQVLGRDIDHRSDIFSLGVVLYEMLTGRAPFSGATIGDTMDRILHAEPEMFPIAGDDDLGRIVGKCLEKDREQRYQSARELWTELTNVQKGSGAVAAAADRANVSRTLILPTLSKSRWAVALAGILIVAAVLSVWLINDATPVLSFAPRDFVLVTDVDNQTGEPVFDKSLSTAFAVGLEQSRYANILPRSRITGALRRMKKTGSEPISEELGRDIALREGARAVILASIGGVGDTYQLAVRIQDPATTRNVWTEQTTFNGKDKVLPAVDTLVAEIRAALGESLSAIAATSKPLAEVTTGSMEALKQYSLAIEKHRAANFTEAKTYYENAIRLDPNFTAAKGSLGIVNFEFFDIDTGKRLLSEAVQHVDSLTDIEKYGILAFHARAVENDQAKSIQFYKLLLALHPDLAAVSNNLGWYSFQLGQGKEAEAAYKEALRLDPNMMLTYNGLTMVYLYNLGDLDSALAVIKKQLSYDIRQASPYENMGLVYIGKDDLNAAEQSFKQSVEINGNMSEPRYLLGHTYLLQGRYREAVDTYLAILGSNPIEYHPYYFAGLTCQQFADRNCERDNFALYLEQVNRRIRNNPNNLDYQFDLAIARARLGQTAQAEVRALEAAKLDASQHVRFAQFLNAQGKTNEAIDRLDLAIKSGFRNFVWLKAHPDLHSLRNVPRFRELLKANLKGAS